MTGIATNSSPAVRPYPPANFFEGIANAMRFRRDPLAMMLETAARGDVVPVFLPRQTGVMVSDPEVVRRVLIVEPERYDKGTRGFRTLKLILGDGLVTSEGDFWRRQRRIAQPAFHKNRISAFAETIVQHTDDLAAEWEVRAKTGKSFDAAEDFMNVTLRIIASTMLSTDLKTDQSETGEALAGVLTYINSMIFNPVPLWFPTPTNLRFRRAARFLDGVVARLIAGRRASGTPGEDLLGMLLSARDPETGAGMSDRELRDEVMTIFSAGRETIANLLAWTAWLVARHPDVRARLEAEVDEVFGDRAPDMAGLGRLTYQKAVLFESMRLFPPAWVVSRRCKEPDVLGDLAVPANSMVFVAPWVLHRDPRWFPEPDRFLPARFLPGAPEPPKGAYFPFGAGLRTCIGRDFAMMESQLVFARLVQRFSWKDIDDRPMVPEPLITLRPKDGVWLRATPR
jgi:cytochrome P450